MAAAINEEGGTESVIAMIDEDNVNNLKMLEKAYSKAKLVKEPTEAELNKLKV